MYLYLDNSGDENVIFFISKDGVRWNEIKKQSGGNGSLLIALSEMMDEQKFSPDDLRGIAVKVGVGRFTSTRVAVTVANTLAFTLKIPVVSIKEAGLEKIKEILEKTPVGQYAHAVYSAEPRIGK